ncbi:MAG: dTDP-4-dehydrorhamnose 3,5-epimerase [Bacilli bacterium]|nr:dTDP-4-dehydrorhamnose 3,5-epimerase [Bacilli bacterium]MDD4809255.1 dTDP-4-dehydrorhamnose 3,5-epimerase [Bacilli bacterium]
MKLIKTNLKDCYLIEPNKFEDERGYFSPYFIQKDYIMENIKFNGVVQANRSKSSKGVLRGLHFQLEPKSQAKIVEVIKGSAVDIVVDIREYSPTYGKYECVLLSDDNNRQLFIPKGFAHGFISLEDNSVFQYLVDNDYAPELEKGILLTDPELKIPLDKIFKEYEIDNPLLSEKDQKHLTLSKSPKFFKY